jgi:hypothetical protein
MDSYFLYYNATYGGCKSRPVHLTKDVIFSILKDRSAQHYYCCLWYFSSFYTAICLLGGSSIPHMNTFETPLGYVSSFLNFVF